MGSDPVNHPAHYADNKIAGRECIEVTRHFLFDPGNAIKYCWRAGDKTDHLQDLDKAVFYLNDAIEHKPVVGTSAVRAAESLAEDLFNSDDPPTTREVLVVSIVSRVAKEDYTAALMLVEELRDFVKENTNAA